ncbi:MAG: RNA-binding S4 domain-containing protein [Proteobacteria bacterium]|nr:RNA-binding S4 domain-containing protein [Pseudomonadota bacterium]
MQTIEFQLDEKHQFVELCSLLKLTGIAQSGGQGKLMVANGEVTVDNQLETRKTAKIFAGQLVTCKTAQITVVAAGLA